MRPTSRLINVEGVLFKFMREEGGRGDGIASAFPALDLRYSDQPRVLQKRNSGNKPLRGFRGFTAECAIVTADSRTRVTSQRRSTT